VTKPTFFALTRSSLHGKNKIGIALRHSYNARAQTRLTSWIWAFTANSTNESTMPITLDNGAISVELDSLGATLRRFKVHRQQQDPLDIALYYKDVARYQSDSLFLGSTLGRFAGRLDSGCFVIDGQRFQVLSNDGPHSLHGGPHGFHQQHWQVESVSTTSVQFGYCSPADPDDFPGELKATVEYALLDSTSLGIGYRASCDMPTVVNLSNHAYFNLNGMASQSSIANHDLMIAADHFLPTRVDKIPTGELRPVAGSAFDFAEPTRLAERISEQYFDHCFVLRHGSEKFRLAATLSSPLTNLRLELLTTHPAIQLYVGHSMGSGFVPNQGLCLEAQNVPNAPNQPQFAEASLLHPGQCYEQTIIYRIGSHHEN